MCTAKTAIISLAVLSSVCIIVLSRYQLIADKVRRRPTTDGPASASRTYPLRDRLNRTIDTSTATAVQTLLQDVILAGRRKFDVPVISGNYSGVRSARGVKLRPRLHFRYVIDSPQTCRHRSRIRYLSKKNSRIFNEFSEIKKIRKNLYKNSLNARV